MQYLQSKYWQAFQEALGRTTYRASGSGWHFLAVHEQTRFGLRIYTPCGPVADSADALEEALSELRKYAQKQGAYCIRVEPEVATVEIRTQREMLEKTGFRHAHKNINPEKTIVNNVTDEEQVIDSTVHVRIRQAFRKNLAAGMEFRLSYEPKDIEIFLSMVHDVSSRTGMQPHPDSYFVTFAHTLFATKSAGMIIASYKDQGPVAVIVFTLDQGVMSYLYAASYSRFRKLSPTKALGLFALHFAHEHGCQIFDFLGIAPDSAPESHSWHGFTSFKREFNGREVDHAGTWELPLKSVQHNLAYVSAVVYDTVVKHLKPTRHSTTQKGKS